MACCQIALGGNLGDVAWAFEAALSRLAATPGIANVKASPALSTQPVGKHAEALFLNAAAEIETRLEPLELLDLLQLLERQAGRSAGGRWAPRPLDLDLIFYGDRVIDHPRLQVPHPACWYRRFVLDPLASIAAAVRHPVKQCTVGELRERLLPRPLRVALAGSSATIRQRVGCAIATMSPAVEVVEWTNSPREDNEPAIIPWLGNSVAAEVEAVAFADLPRVPRLDISQVSDPVEFLRGVLQAAIG